MRQLHRITIEFFGKVQGVGFRKAVFQIVEPWHVTGFVQNTLSNTVLVVMESSQDRSSLLIQKLQDIFFIVDVRVDIKDALNNLPCFYIKL